MRDLDIREICKSGQTLQYWFRHTLQRLAFFFYLTVRVTFVFDLIHTRTLAKCPPIYSAYWCRVQQEAKYCHHRLTSNESAKPWKPPPALFSTTSFARGKNGYLAGKLCPTAKDSDHNSACHFWSSSAITMVSGLKDTQHFFSRGSLYIVSLCEREAFTRRTGERHFPRSVLCLKLDN